MDDDDEELTLRVTFCTGKRYRDLVASNRLGRHDVIVLAPVLINPTEHADTIRIIAKHAHDWVDVCGQQSELIHDLIDESAVQVGRQERVGDGKPMTAWFADVIDQPAMLDHVLHPLVGCDWRVVVMFASEEMVADYNRSFLDLITRVQPTAAARWLVDIPNLGTPES